ncbi:hypothetical protein J6590_008115 [Homalodisca vitripennis]|nr:hypothetical protein J6590_008115 [Homalodisca vitripennis]
MAWCTLLLLAATVLLNTVCAKSHVFSRDLSSNATEEAFVAANRPRTTTPPPCSKEDKCSRKPCSKKEYVINTSLKLNWFQAWIHCAQKGRRLATVENREEEVKLLTAIWKSRAPMDVWLGATDLGQRGKFTWLANGQPMKYARWQIGEPNFAGGYEPCVLLYRVRSDYRWFNVDCIRRHSFACEYIKGNSTDIPVDWKG